MIITPESHLDHGLTPAHIALIMDRFGPLDFAFTETMWLPEHLPDVPCALYGPCVGDDAVPESEVFYQIRGSRAWSSRMVRRPLRGVRLLSVIAGPSGDVPSILYTAFGGPVAPREPGDPDCQSDHIIHHASVQFWKRHAIAVEV